jgi:hypothetical protein
MAPRTSLLCIDWGNYETWFCSPATVRHRASSASVRNQTTGAACAPRPLALLPQETAPAQRRGCAEPEHTGTRRGVCEEAEAGDGAKLKEQHRQSTEHALGELDELKKQHQRSKEAALKEIEGLQSTNHDLDTLNTRLRYSIHNRSLEVVDSQELLELQSGGRTAHSSDKLRVLNERSDGQGGP